MSCGNRIRPVNPERPGEHGRWVMPPRPASRSATGHKHTWQYSNATGTIGGPVVTVCTGCGESHLPTWVADAVSLALPASASFIVGQAEWADVLRERGAA
jgi:hypothetical protein